MFVKLKDLPLVVWDNKRVQNALFQLRTLPPSVYLGRHQCHSYDKMEQAFPPLFQTGQWEGLGTMLRLYKRLKLRL